MFYFINKEIGYGSQKNLIFIIVLLITARLMLLCSNVGKYKHIAW